MDVFKVFLSNNYTVEHNKAMKKLIERLVGDYHCIIMEKSLENGSKEFVIIKADEGTREILTALMNADCLYMEKLS